METALNYNAHSVLLCHNHPGGTCAPSQEDIASTLQLQRLLNGVGILVLFRANRSRRESAKIIVILYAAGVIGGLLTLLIGFF